jgi:hypothetical protein
MNNAYKQIVLVPLLALLACSDSDSAPETKEDSAAGEQADAVYLVAANPVAGDDASHGDESRTYLNLVEALDESTQVDPAGGVEVPGSPFVHEGVVFVADAEAPTLTRYTLDDSDKLVEGEKLSFAAVGVSTPLESLYFVSKSKGYFFDDTGLRVIVFDPSDMTLTGEEIDISVMNIDDHTAYTYSSEHNVRRRGDTIFVPVVWFDQDDNLRRNNGILVIDTREDEVVRLLDDERCGGGGASITAANGDFYFFPSAGNSLQYTTSGDPSMPSCALRIQKDHDELDPDFTLPLSEKVAGAAAQGAIPTPKGFLFTAVDKRQYEARETDYAPFWAFKRYDLASNEVEAVADIPFWTGSTYYFQTAGRTFIPLFQGTLGDGSTWKSTYYEVTDAPQPVELFSIDARWGTLARLR